MVHFSKNQHLDSHHQTFYIHRIINYQRASPINRKPTRIDKKIHRYTDTVTLAKIHGWETSLHPSSLVVKGWMAAFEFEFGSVHIVSICPVRSQLDNRLQNRTDTVCCINSDSLMRSYESQDHHDTTGFQQHYDWFPCRELAIVWNGSSSFNSNRKVPDFHNQICGTTSISSKISGKTRCVELVT